MAQAARSGLVLLGLALLVVLGGLWGWSAMTQPFPGKTTPPKCVTTVVQAGKKVFPGQVTVSVLNASGRDGLASETLTAFADAGFGEGDAGNAPQGANVIRAVVWAPTPAGPDARLVASRLGPGTKVIDRQAPGAGVTVVLGDGFDRLVKGRPSVKAGRESEICSPPVA